jgi:hypothetical protein
VVGAVHAAINGENLLEKLENSKADLFGGKSNRN